MVKEELARGRRLGTGNYGLALTLATAPFGPVDGAGSGTVAQMRPQRAEERGRWEHPPLDPPQSEVPFQHRAEFEPGRRRGEEKSRQRLKEEKGQ